MKAKNIQDYKNAWQWHIDQLASLALAADIEYTDYTDVKSIIERWLTSAIRNQNWSTENGEG